MHITYFAPDLSETSVARRVRMLLDGGASVTPIGFHRGAAPVEQVEGVAAVDLGRTEDGRLVSRSVLIAREAWRAGRWREIVRRSDAILARNLDMCIIADAARIWAASSVPLNYECLDIHGSLLGNGLASRVLRAQERRLLRRSRTLTVSSPGFLSNYFHHLCVNLPTVILDENKRKTSEPRKDLSHDYRSGPPWRIGWFGNIRCVESFQILKSAAEHLPNLVDISLRGRPTAQLQDLIDQHLPKPNMRFGGLYHQTDLAEMYQDVHIMWAIDYSQRGANSKWLLPNRIYEAGYYNCPVIALAGTQTSTWLEEHGTGIIMRRPPTEVETFLAGLDTSTYRRIRSSTATIPTADVVHTNEDCRRFVAQMAERARSCQPSDG